MNQQMVRKIKKKTKKWLSFVCLSNKQEIQKAVKNAKVISFDLFDTLVKRDVPSPESVHLLVENKMYSTLGFKIENYSAHRIQAELDARKHSRGKEITLEDIFQYFPNIDDETRKVLQKLEMETEYEICCPDQYMKSVYEKALLAGKTIVFTSDMYLPEDFIRRILEKCGYCSYKKLYLSSSYGVTKSSGQLFDIVLQELACEPESILHIGDHIKGDYYRPKQRNINACLIATEQRNLEFYKKRKVITWEQQLFYTFLNNHKPVEGTDFSRSVGYEILGPMLWGFCTWLHEQLEIMQPDKIFFLSREGAILQKAYNILYPDDRMKQCYLSVSRQAVQIPMISKCRSYYEFLQLIKPLMHTHSLRNVGYSCMFDERYEQGIDVLGLKMEDNAFEIPDNKREAYFQLIMELGKEKFDEQHGLIQQYLEEAEFYGKVAIIDIGWQGTMQKYLMSYAGEKITKAVGFYLGVRNVQAETEYAGLNRKGFFFEPGIHDDYNLEMRFTTEVLETLFMNRQGSVEKYRYDRSGNVVPVLGKIERDRRTSNLLEQMQDIALLFLSDLKLQKTEAKKALSVETIMLGYETFAVRPALKSVYYFKNFSFIDAEIKKMLPQHATIYYLLQPWKVAKEMEGSICKIFFLKSILKIRLPYFQILKFLLYRLNIKSQFRKNMDC